MRRIAYVCAFLCLVSTARPTATAGGRAEVHITYVGNEGFLVASGGRKVLVDALYREGVEGYAVPGEDSRYKLERAKRPFDKVDLVLTTHHHADHFDAAAVGTHLAHNDEALFVGTPQSVTRLRSYVGENRAVLRRIRAGFPREGQRIRMVHHGINLELINLHHGRGQMIENIGFVFELGGGKFLHMGDSQAKAKDFRRSNVHRETFDVAFVPYWYLAYDRMAATARAVIHAKHIVAMHVPPRGSALLNDLGGWAGMERKIKGGFPNAVLFEREMESKTLSLH
ncbi:MAG: MBL fold metallo-hydrolase [Candidatus Krumholzibacteriia bacterium]